MTEKPIDWPNGDIAGSLRTVDGLVILRKSIPETFEIALKLLDLLKKRFEEGDK